MKNLTEAEKAAKEAKLIEVLKEGYAEAKSQGIAAVMKWGRQNRRKIRKLKRISDKTTKELSNLVGCSTVVFRYDERRKWRRKKSRPSSSQPTFDKPEKFGLEFWQRLLGTKKVGEVMVEVLKSLFDQIADKNDQIAQLTKERDDCRQGWKKAEARFVEIQKELKNHREVVKHRDRLLAQSVHKALLKSGERSLNDGA